MQGKKVWIIGDSDVYLFVVVLVRCFYTGITVIFQLFPNSKRTRTFRSVAVAKDGKLTRLMDA